MVSQDRWIEERDALARELHTSMGEDAIRGELRDRWNIEAGPDEGDPALMLANVRLSEEVRTDATETHVEASRT